MSSSIRSTIGLALAVGLVAVVAQAEEKAVPVEQVPPVVVKAIKEQFPNAEMRQAKRDTLNEELVYEVDVSVDGEPKEVVVTTLGFVLRVDQ